jgi:hypothetical protein
MSFIQKHSGQRAALLPGGSADQHRKRVRHS